MEVARRRRQQFHSLYSSTDILGRQMQSGVQMQLALHIFFLSEGLKVKQICVSDGDGRIILKRILFPKHSHLFPFNTQPVQ
jgi:hypothetical protein